MPGCRIFARTRLGPGAAALSLLLWGTQLAGAATLERQVRQIVEEERVRAGAPAMCVAVLRGGVVEALVATGQADPEAGVSASPETRFPAASLSKLLTAVLVMRQVERGALDLDAPANDYLDAEHFIRDPTGAPVDASLRQLLIHRSGLPVSWGGIAEWGDPVVPMERHLADSLTTVHPPGSRLIYANDAFALAGMIAARSAGQGFEEHVQEVLLDPLRMPRSGFESAWAADPPLAAAYGGLFGGTDRTRHVDTTAIAPAGGLLTTAPDLARFALMILRGGQLEGARILGPDTIAEMMRLQTKADPLLDEGFGLGFAVRERPGWRLVWWDGSLPGAAARLAFLPDAGVGVVVLSNLADNEPTSVAARRILELMVPAPPRQPYQPTRAELEQISGTYRLLDVVDPKSWFLGLFATLELRPSPRGRSLWQRSRFFGETELQPVGPGHFRMRGTMFDDATLIADGETLFVSSLEGKRISGLETPTGLALGLALLVFGLFVLAAQVLLAARRRRAARR